MLHDPGFPVTAQQGCASINSISSSTAKPANAQELSKESSHGSVCSGPPSPLPVPARPLGGRVAMLVGLSEPSVPPLSPQARSQATSLSTRDHGQELGSCMAQPASAGLLPLKATEAGPAQHQRCQKVGLHASAPRGPCSWRGDRGLKAQESGREREIALSRP